jgi:hypothetical protein
MTPEQFFNFLSLLEVGAFRICEAILTITFISVYGWMAFRHIVNLARKEK